MLVTMFLVIKVIDYYIVEEEGFPSNKPRSVEMCEFSVFLAICLCQAVGRLMAYAKLAIHSMHGHISSAGGLSIFPVARLLYIDDVDSVHVDGQSVAN